MDVNKFLTELFVKVLDLRGSGALIIVSAILMTVFWVLVVGWVWNDILERTGNRYLRLLSAFLVIVFGPAGLAIYLLVRPRDTIEEIYWEDLEKRYLIYETSELRDCPKCGYQLNPGFINCPRCGHSVKERCSQCAVYIEKEWGFCPYCGLKKEIVTEQTYEPSPTEMLVVSAEDASESALKEATSGVGQILKRVSNVFRRGPRNTQRNSDKGEKELKDTSDEMKDSSVATLVDSAAIYDNQNDNDNNEFQRGPSMERHRKNHKKKKKHRSRK